MDIKEFNLKVYQVVNNYLHNQTKENIKIMYIKLLQNLQDEIACKNGTIGDENAISDSEMDIQHIINYIQNNL